MSETKLLSLFRRIRKTFFFEVNLLTVLDFYAGIEKEHPKNNAK